MKNFDIAGKIKKSIAKKLMPKIASAIKPGLLTLLEKAEEYRDSIKLEPGEVTVVGIIFLEKGKGYLSPCVMRVSERNRLEVSRNLQKIDFDDLADLLIKNMDKVDFSNILTDIDDE